MTRGGPAQLLQTSSSNRRGDARLAGFPTGKQCVMFRTRLWLLTVARVNTLGGVLGGTAPDEESPGTLAENCPIPSRKRTKPSGYLNSIEKASRQTSAAARISPQSCAGWEITLLFQGNGISPSSSPSGPAHGSNEDGDKRRSAWARPHLLRS